MNSLACKIGSNVKWIKHFECIIPSIHCMLCHVGVTPLMKTGMLKSIYIAYFQSAVLFGIAAWRNSTDDKYLKENP